MTSVNKNANFKLFWTHSVKFQIVILFKEEAKGNI